MPSTLRLFFALLLLVFPARAEPPARFTATVSGEGPDVILIPGLASPASIWEATVAQLARGRRVHVLQVAGFAGAPVAGNAVGPVLAPLVEEIAAYLAAQKLAQPVIIGHSLGGVAALLLAARHPDAVGRVLAVDASPFFPMTMSPGATAETARPFAELLRAQIASQTPEFFAAGQEAILQRMLKSEPLRATLVPLTGKSDPKVVAQAMYDLMTTDVRPELADIRAPLTVLYAYDEEMGTSAESVDRLFQTSYANAKAARLVRVDGGLHFIMLDQPEKFAAAVEEFLK